MAFADTYSTYNSGATGALKANREELADFISIIEPEVTPVTSAISKGSTKSVFTEWLCEDLSPAKVNSTAEGHDSSSWFNKSENRARLGNYINISKREFGVSDIQQMVDQAGIDSEIDHAKSKSVRELKRDIEAVVCGVQDRATGGSGAYASRGLFDWIDASGPADVPAMYRPSAGSISSTSDGTDMTEGDLNGVLQSLFTDCGEKKTYMGVMAPKVVDIIDNFTRVEASGKTRYQVNEQAGSKTINMEVKTFNSSFGIINIIPSVFLGGSNSGAEETDADGDSLAFTYDDDAGLILDTDLLELKFLDPLHTETFEDRGGGPRGHAKAVYTLCVKNPKANGKILAAD